MPRDIEITGIFLHANATPCFHACRYCQLRTSKAVPAPFSRYEALVNRFIDWRITTGRADFEIAPWYGNSHDCPPETLRGIRRLSERLGDGQTVVLLGGTAHRPMPEMHRWLDERRAVGIDTVVASFAGHDGRHDHWNNKAGNYRFHLDTLRLAAKMGFALQERVFLIRSSLAGLEQLFDDLDGIEAPAVRRWSFPLFYSGRARRLEHERPGEQEIAALPPRLQASLRDDHSGWRSERRWIEEVRRRGDETPERMPLSLPISEHSLDWAGQRSCDQIVDELTARWRAAYRAAPSRLELCERYGDRQSDKVYMALGQVERLWFDRYRKENPCHFDIRSTRFF